MPQTTTTQPDFSTLLEQATTTPGTISAAYSAFHGYSLGNQILAMFQCQARGIPLGPIASFNRWKELGRHVTKGQKAIELCMPITCKRTLETTGGPEDAGVTHPYADAGRANIRDSAALVEHISSRRLGVHLGGHQSRDRKHPRAGSI